MILVVLLLPQGKRLSMGLVQSCCGSTKTAFNGDTTLAVVVADSGECNQGSNQQCPRDVDRARATREVIGAVEIRSNELLPVCPHASHMDEAADLARNPLRSESGQEEHSTSFQGDPSPASHRRAKLRSKPQLELFGTTLASAATRDDTQTTNSHSSSTSCSSANSRTTSVDASMRASTSSRRRTKGPSSVRFHEFALLPVASHLSENESQDEVTAHSPGATFGIVVGQGSSSSHPCEVTMDEIVFSPHDVDSATSQHSESMVIHGCLAPLLTNSPSRRGDPRQDEDMRAPSWSGLVPLSTQESTSSFGQRFSEMTPRTVSLKMVPLVDAPYSQLIAHKTRQGSEKSTSTTSEFE